MSFFYLDKNMSQIEEVDACDRFMSEVVAFLLPIEQRRSALVDMLFPLKSL